MTRDEYARQHAQILAADEAAVADFEIGVLALPADIAAHLAAILNAGRRNRDWHAADDVQVIA